MAKKVYGVPERDSKLLRRILDRERAPKGNVVNRPPKQDRGSRSVFVLKSPDGWTAGRAITLRRRLDRPFVFDFALIGYPILRLNAPFTISWTGTFDGVERTLESAEIASTANAEEFLAAQPEELQAVIASVYGGLVEDERDETAVAYDTGRWFVAFSEEPEWTPDTTFGFENPALNLEVGLRISRTAICPAGPIVDVWDIGGSGEGIRPVHPGSLAVASYCGTGLILTAVEPRIYVPLESEQSL